MKTFLVNFAKVVLACGFVGAPATAGIVTHYFTESMGFAVLAGSFAEAFWLALILSIVEG